MMTYQVYFKFDMIGVTSSAHEGELMFQVTAGDLEDAIVLAKVAAKAFLREDQLGRAKLYSAERIG
jgi:hypothetical protein